MSVKVLVADDSNIVRKAIRSVLAEEPRIHIVGEAENFHQAVQMVTDFKPEVLLLDLHLAKERDLPPALVKSQFSSVRRVVAVSFANDAEAKELAASYGAQVLLDKMKLYNDLLPSILQCLSNPERPQETVHRSPPSSITSFAHQWRFRSYGDFTHRPI